jgi:hypothetical protein
LRHPDYVLELPQSGEHIRGHDNLLALRAAHPGPPAIQPRRIWRDTRWFGNPLEVPAWRTQWTERMEESPGAGRDGKLGSPPCALPLAALGPRTVDGSGGRRDAGQGT